MTVLTQVEQGKIRGLALPELLQQLAFTELLSSKIFISEDGYPEIEREAFEAFLHRVPHLFQCGSTIIEACVVAQGVVTSSPEISPAEMETLWYALQLLKTLVSTAAICAPTDLWLIRYVLCAHRRSGILGRLISGETVSVPDYQGSDRIDPAIQQLACDLSFLYSRGYLDHDETGFRLSAQATPRTVYQGALKLPDVNVIDYFNRVVEVLACKVRRPSRQHIFEVPVPPQPPGPPGSWVANLFQVEIGFRLVPVMLSLATQCHLRDLCRGSSIRAVVPNISYELENLLLNAGMISKWGHVTQYGERVFQRGTGPFGIIYSYRPYLNQLTNRLQGKPTTATICRDENVLASQRANRRWLRAANDSLDLFCQQFGWQYRVFIEHAFGAGEATRQRFQRNGEKTIRYVGADIDPEVSNQAIQAQETRELPHNLLFLESVDIGRPQELIRPLKNKGLPLSSSVMVVGNGFHEIRERSGQRLVQILREYQEAGILLIFIEESAIDSVQLRATGWNTYHAGFRYVHQISGQVLRPSSCDSVRGEDDGWQECVQQADYLMLHRFSKHSRRIAPCPNSIFNPSISVLYFCVPRKLARQLHIHKND